jgi:hypothetical protein
MNSIVRITKGLICALAVISIATLSFIPAQAQESTSQVVREKKSIDFANDAVVREWLEVPNTWSAPAKGKVPFHALMSGSAAFTSPTTVEFFTTGYATQLFRFVTTGIAFLDPPTGPCPGVNNGIPNVHTETLTAGNGDELVIEMVNVACPTGPFTFHGKGHWTVLSGTGRFQNVTGQGTNEGGADFEGGTFVMAFTGTLMFP